MSAKLEMHGNLVTLEPEPAARKLLGVRSKWLDLVKSPDNARRTTRDAHGWRQQRVLLHWKWDRWA